MSCTTSRGPASFTAAATSSSVSTTGDAARFRATVNSARSRGVNPAQSPSRPYTWSSVWPRAESRRFASPAAYHARSWRAMIQLACAFSSGVRSPFVSADRWLRMRAFPWVGKFASSRTHCGSGPAAQSSGRIARALASSTSGSRGVRVRAAARAFSASARGSGAGRRFTVARVGWPFASNSSGATLLTAVLYFSEVGVR